MWPRTAEVMLALWLATTPFVFRFENAPPLWWAIAFGAAVLVLMFSLLSFWPPARRAYLGSLAVGVGLAAFGYFAGGRPNPPALQSFLITGLLLIMLGVIPSDTARPPPAWQRFYEKQ